jgi:hypothetical protein
LLAYFSITLCKSIFPSREFRSILSFVTFIVTLVIVYWVKNFVVARLPFFVEFQSYALQKSSSASITQVSISGLLYELIVIVVLFVSTSFILEKRIEL